MIDLYDVTDEALLAMRLCDLPVSIDEGNVSSWIEEFKGELTKKNICYSPKIYLADEWLCPEGVPAIGVPYYLAHPRLKALEQKMMHEVEGGTKDEFLRLIRHEMGHAISYAFQVQKKKKWRLLFGSPNREETEYYHYKKYSTSFVYNLKDFYSQSHPDEDFAETFAVWLNPSIDWKQQYKSWKAYKKLLYVDELMSSLIAREPVVESSEKYFNIRFMRSRVSTVYKNKRRLYASNFPDYYDRELCKLFLSKENDGYSSEKSGRSASVFLRKHKRYVVNVVSEWTQVKKYVADCLVSTFIRRSRDLALQCPSDEESVLVSLVGCVTAMVKTYQHCAVFKEKKRIGRPFFLCVILSETERVILT